MSEMKNSKFSCYIKYFVSRISLLTISILMIGFTDCQASQSLNYQPNDSVSGVITDLYTGQPLSEVTITVAGTDIVVKSDKDGIYTIAIPDGSTYLIYSYPDYQTLTIEIAERKKIYITLSPIVSPQESPLWSL